MQKISLKIKPVKTRNTWSINPVSRIKPSKKLYSRKKYSILL
jgi:hypothetical protein